MAIPTMPSDEAYKETFQRPIEVQYVQRLTRQAYTEFEKGFYTGVPKNDVEAAYFLGQQAVLKKLRGELNES